MGVLPLPEEPCEGLDALSVADLGGVSFKPEALHFMSTSQPTYPPSTVLEILAGSASVRARTNVACAM